MDPHNLPPEPFPFFNTSDSQHISLRRPGRLIAFGVIMIVVGLCVPFSKGTSEVGGLIGLAFFAILGGFLTYCGLRRRSWAIQYQQITGSSPWADKDQALNEQYMQTMQDELSCRNNVEDTNPKP